MNGTLNTLLPYICIIKQINMMNNTAAVTAFIDQLMASWNSHDKQLILSYYADDYSGVESSEAGELYGRDSVARMLDKFFVGFPDLHISLIDFVQNGDRLALYWKAEGRQTGPIINIPPTGKKVSIQGVSFLHINDGLITRGAHLWDMAGMLRDLGLLPRLS